MRRNIYLALLTAFVLVALALPSTAQAQWRGRRLRTRVVVGGFYDPFWFSGWGYPYWAWGPYWGWGPWYGNPWMGYGYGYGYGQRDDSASLKLDVKPKDAQVYVDGYYRGTVDDFDGVFSRLHVAPGEHQLVIYKSGFRTIKQSIRVRPRQGSKIQYVMQQLAAGETAEAPPQPPPQEQQQAEPQRPPSRRYGRMPPPSRMPPPEAPPDTQAPPPAGNEASAFGTLVLRVQPAGAQILIDGERWQGPEGDVRMVVQVGEGRHRVEVRKDGYTSFTTEVTVRPGETVPLNVSLPPSR